MIKIHYDFTDGTEVSYMEGSKLKDNFTTNCLDFFCFDIDVDDIQVISKYGDILSRNSLLLPNKHTSKKILKYHNIHNMLKAGTFNWYKLPSNTDSKLTNNIVGHSLANDELYELCSSPKELIFRYNYTYGIVGFMVIALRDKPIEILVAKLKPDEIITFSLNSGDDTNVEQIQGSIYWNHETHGKCVRIKSSLKSIEKWLNKP